MNTFAAASAEFKSHNWLITPEAFSLVTEAISAQSIRDVNAKSSTALISNLGKVEGNQGKTAILPIVGPLATYDNFISQALGWTTYESIISQHARFESDPDIAEIVLLMDTPGGVTKGISEVCHAVKRSSKNTTTYVTGTCASAGYWLASQSSSISCAPDSMIGSIGVKIQFYRPQSNELTSKNAPYKNMTEAVAQAYIDDIEELFLADVSSGRGVSVEYVKQNYGKGAVMTGGKALTAGMVDSVSLIGEFISGTNNSKAGANSSLNSVDGWDDVYAKETGESHSGSTLIPGQHRNRQIL